MTPGGWIVMLLSVSAVSILFAWCIYKVLTIPDESKKLHGFEGTPPDHE